MGEFAEENELISVQIILHAGDARVKVTEGLQEAKRFDFEKAEALMEEAEKAFVLAHKAQTEIIQNEASGESYEFSLLFAHAQDTLMTIHSELMTIHSELRMAKEMVDILKIIEEKTK